ncbi:MAG TPA: TFIIB-type zinc ribbon-containing protein [Lacipirellulaceae bacterium]
MAATHHCPECNRPVRSADARNADYVCCYCGAELVRDDGRWTNVARVANLAEAGFLVDELSGDGIDARIYQADDFNALTDRWSVSYLIQASPREAPQVAARIRQHLAEIDARSAELDESRTSGEEYSAIDPVFWRPLAVAVLAGMASFALGQRFGHDRGELRPPARNSLAVAVTAIGRPLVTEPAPGVPRHRLTYQWRDQSWMLDTDSDGDGIYELHQRFQSSGAGW